MKTVFKVSALVLIAAGLVRAYQIYGTALLERRGPKPPMTRTALGEELLQESHRRRYNEILHRARRVQTLMEQSRRQGFDVSIFEPKLQHAMDLARQGKFDDALLRLNLIEVRLPRRRETLK